MTQVAEPIKIKKEKLLKIMPYIPGDLDPESMEGQLARYDSILHDGADQKEALTYLERNGIRRYLTGLNEFAPEIQGIRDENEKKAAIREIRKKVIFLESAINSNVINPKEIENIDFWNKVKTIKPDNYPFWDDVFIQAGNHPVYLNSEDPYDLIKICGIEANGFSLIASSYEAARLAAKPPKFYLDRESDTAISKVEVKKIKNKAIAFLNDLSKNSHTKLFYLIKNIDSNPSQYTKSTSENVIYDYLDNYISGTGPEKSMKKASNYFNELCEISEEDLRIKAVIADASFYKNIAMKGDGLLYHRTTDTMLGRNVSEVLSFFKNPINSKIWESVFEEVDSYWKS